VIVVDASVLANALGDDHHAGDAARQALADAGELTLPDLADVETVAVLRKRWLAGDVTDQRLEAAVADLSDLPARRYPAGPLLPRVVELRHNVSAYDAVYVALAELLDCDLVTADRRLTTATGPRCTFLLVTT
jgi:predicted nucleic acid-binding protein